MEQQKASPYRFLTYIACIMMIIGANLPQYVVNGIDSVNKIIFNVDNEGVILYSCAMIIIIMKYCKVKKYILAPVAVEIGILVYYLIYFIKSNEFKMVHIGFILEVASIVFLIISLFIKDEFKKEKIHDLCTLNIMCIDDEDEYVEKIIAKDIWWIILTVALTIIMIVFKVRIL